MRGALLALSLCLLLVGCGTEYSHRFRKGDLVTMKMDGRTGTVMTVFRYWDGLHVRFAQDSHSAPMLGGRVRVRPYDTVLVHDWELRPAYEEKPDGSMGTRKLQ
jgi:hypothetical protein